MRNKIWSLIRRNIPEGQILPRWAFIVRAVLFPLDFFYWKMSQSRGYDVFRDVWVIEDMIWSAESLRALTREGKVFKVIKGPPVITIEEITKN